MTYDIVRDVRHRRWQESRCDGWELLGLRDDSEFEEERAGGGPGPSRRRAGAGGSVPTTSIRSTGGALTNRMAAETLGVRADIACVLYICTWAVTTIPKCC